MSIKEFWLKVVSSSSDINSKIIGGFISLAFTIVFGFTQYTEPMIIMAGLTTAFFGLSSMDFKTISKTIIDTNSNNKASEINIENIENIEKG